MATVKTLDAKYTGAWKVAEDGTTLKKDTILQITPKGYDLSYYGTHQTFSKVETNPDGTVTATMPVGNILFADADSAIITTYKPQRLERAGPSPSPGTGSEKSGDTGMALILGLVLVGLFAFNDIF